MEQVYGEESQGEDNAQAGHHSEKYSSSLPPERWWLDADYAYKHEKL